MLVLKYNFQALVVETKVLVLETMVLAAMYKYVSREVECDEDDCLLFWECNKTQLDKLFMPAMRALSIHSSF